MGSRTQHKTHRSSSLSHVPPELHPPLNSHDDATTVRCLVMGSRWASGISNSRIAAFKFATGTPATQMSHEETHGRRIEKDTTSSLPTLQRDCEATIVSFAPINGLLYTDMETMLELRRLISRSSDPKAIRMIECFESPNVTPPITKQSLSELDLQSIVNNPKLRHDINFNRELHFRPNLNGAKGKAKMRAIEDYWLALTVELELYTILTHGDASERSRQSDSWTWKMKASQRRIPRMFETIKDILKTLVPERDQPSVDEHLDVSMLMQEIEKGICDLNSIARWLAQLLKAHCAPMRDESVDRMVRCIEQGVQFSRAHLITDGLRELFAVLEAMKLDVANHQIRNLRMMLIEDTISFEQTSSLAKIKRGRINVEQAQHWYSREDEYWASPAPPGKPEASRLSQFEVFMRAILRLLLCPYEPFPDIFNLDTERLRSLRVELQDVVCYEICNELFTALTKHLGRTDPIPESIRGSLHNDLNAIVGDGGRAWVDSIENVAVEVHRHALRFCGSSSIYDAGLVSFTQEWLRHALCHPSSSSGIFLEHTQSVGANILENVLVTAGKFMNASSVDIFNAFVAPAASVSPPLLHARSKEQTTSLHSDPLTDITRRITHIAVLHWRIWAPIVYLLPEPLSPSGFPHSDIAGAGAVVQATGGQTSPSPWSTTTSEQAQENSIPVSSLQSTSQWDGLAGSEVPTSGGRG